MHCTLCRVLTPTWEIQITVVGALWQSVAAPALQDGAWHHVVVVWERGIRMDVCVGHVVGSARTSLGVSNHAVFWIPPALHPLRVQVPGWDPAAQGQSGVQ